MPSGVYDHSHIVPWNKGVKGVIKASAETKAKLSAMRMGHRSYTLGMKFGEETRRKHSETSKRLGLKPPNMTGYKHTAEARKNMSEGQRRSGYMQYAKGPTAPNWKGGVHPENRKWRNLKEFKEWREAVFARDNWTCQHCGARGVHLHPHHIKEFAKFLELRFEVSNGLTLCAPCHMRLHGLDKKALVTLRTKGGKIIEVSPYKAEIRVKQGCTVLTAQTPAT